MRKINNVFRRVRNIPLYIKDNGTISSALYLDSKGVSVSIDDDRKLDDIIALEEKVHNHYNEKRLKENPDGEYKLIAIGAVSKAACDEKNVVIELDPDGDINPYHAILKKNVDEVLLTASQRKHLKKNTKVVKSYDTSLIKEM